MLTCVSIKVPFLAAHIPVRGAFAKTKISGMSSICLLSLTLS